MVGPHPKCPVTWFPCRAAPSPALCYRLQYPSLTPCTPEGIYHPLGSPSWLRATELVDWRGRSSPTLISVLLGAERFLETAPSHLGRQPKTSPNSQPLLHGDYCRQTVEPVCAAATQDQAGDCCEAWPAGRGPGGGKPWRTSLLSGENKAGPVAHGWFLGAPL